MIASDPIRTLRHLLQAGGRPHMDSGLPRLRSGPGMTAERRPVVSATTLVEHGPGRPALGLAERGRKRDRKAFLLLRPEKGRDRKLAPMRRQKQPLDAEFLVHHPLEP